MIFIYYYLKKKTTTTTTTTTTREVVVMDLLFTHHNLLTPQFAKRKWHTFLKTENKVYTKERNGGSREQLGQAKAML